MITKEIAIEKIEEYLRNKSLRSVNTFVLLHDNIREFEYGWVFFYQNKTYLETGNILDLLGGNSPLIVNKYDGEITATGTAHKVDYYIKEYVKRMKEKK